MNIHDNQIINYQVNLRNKTILLQTISETNKAIDIYFNNFVAYYFENQLPGSILLDVFEDDIDKFIQQNREVLKQGKDYFWPINYETEEELLQYLRKSSYHYYIIQSSYGMNGWVISNEMYMNNVKNEKK